MKIYDTWICTKYRAHRGLHDEASPENSLGAYKKAVEKDTKKVTKKVTKKAEEKPVKKVAKKEIKKEEPKAKPSGILCNEIDTKNSKAVTNNDLFS